MKKWVSILLVTGILVSCMTACAQMSYKKALSLIEVGEYTQAYEILETLDNEQAKATKARFRFVPVKSVTTELDNDYEMGIAITYNESHLPLQVEYTASETQPEIYTYTYDEQGRILQEKRVRSSTIDYSYNKNGYLSKELVTYSEGSQRAVLYTYDEHDRLIKAEGAYSSGVTYYTEYTYDANGNLIQDVYKGDNNPRTTNTYTYDANGNCLRHERSDGMVYVCTYDENGNLLQSVTSYSGKEANVSNFTYDANGKLVRREEYYYGKLEWVFVYTYDANGYLAKEEYTSDDGYGDLDVRTNEYTNDAHGNRIKVEHFRDGDSMSVKEIEYRLVYLTGDYPKEIQAHFDRMR